MADQKRGKPRNTRLSPESKIQAKQRRKESLRIYAQSRHVVRLSDGIWEEWNREKSRMDVSTHDEFAKRLLERYYKKENKEPKSPPHTVQQGPAPSSVPDSTPLNQHHTGTKTMKGNETSIVDSNTRSQLNHNSEDSEKVVIKTEPLDTFSTDQSESMAPENLMMDCESVIDNNISLEHHAKGKRVKENESKNPEPLLMDCETVDVDISLAQLNNGVVLESNRSQRDIGQSVSSGLVDLLYVHGVPVNEPFNIQYFSPKLGRSVESKVYMVVEYSSTTEMNPIRLGILGQILEKAALGITSKTYQDFSKSSIISCVDLSNVGSKYPSFAGTHQDGCKKQNPVTSGTCKTKFSVACQTFRTDNSVASKTRKTVKPLTSETRVKLKKRLKERGAKEMVIPESLNDTNYVVVKQEYMVSGTEWEQSKEGEESRISEQRNKSNCWSTSEQKQSMFENRSKENVTHTFGIWSEGHQENYIKQEDSDTESDLMDNDKCVYDSSSTSTADELDYYLAASQITKRNKTEDIVSDILNDTIDLVVNQKVRERKEKRIAAKRKSRGRQSPLRHKLIKFEDGSEENKPHSSRIRSKGYRINYAELDELQPPSDLSDEDKSDLEYMLDDASTDDAEELEHCQIRDENNDSTTPNPKVKNKDPDFLPDSDSDICPDPCYETSLPKSFKKDDLSTDGSDWHSEERPVKRVKKQSSKKKKKVNDDKDAEERHLKKVKQQKSRVTVILSEHTDKFYMEEQVSLEMKNRSKADSEKSFQLMVCGQCNKFRTEDKKQMETHLENHINGDFSCPNCDFEASGKFEMNKHKHENHSKPRQCKLCSTPEHKVVFKIKEFREHYMQNHKDHLNQCTFCGEHYLTEYMHRCTRPSIPVVQCDICGKEMNKNSLPLHRRCVHFNVRAHPCSLCKYSAKNGRALKRHMQAKHEGVRDYKCDLCDFTCVRPFQLTSHMRTHTGAKPYKCDQCPYAAAWNVQLKEHRKLHEGLSALGKPCEICSIVVREGAPYTKHLRKEHRQDV